MLSVIKNSFVVNWCDTNNVDLSCLRSNVQQSHGTFQWFGGPEGLLAAVQLTSRLER